MPPKRRAAARGRKEATDSEDEVPKSKRPCPAKPARAKKSGAYKMPPPLPAGEVLMDMTKGSWVLGDSVGKGGFGEIYRAAPVGTSASAQHANHVIKIEPQENGPLFSELAFYCRAAKAEMIDKWVSSHKLSYLAIPKYISQGRHCHRGLCYRFLVMQCFGEDVEKKFNQSDRQFGVKTVCHLALRMLEALQYLHESEYAHGDIKGSNLLTGLHPSHQHEVYLVDYGLAYRYCPEGKHKEYKEDPRRTHDGTLEFTSIDAHKGVTPAPRGDLEILAYCLLQWSAGSLPWEQCLHDKDRVAQMKIRYKSDVGGLIKDCFPSNHAPACLKEYMSYVHSLSYTAAPDYRRMQQMFIKELGRCGLKDDGKGLDWIATGKKRKIAEEYDGASPPKRAKLAASSNGKQRAKALPPSSVAQPKKPSKAPAKPGTKRKTKQPPREEAVAVVDAIKPVRGSSSLSGGVAEILPQVSYPAELGYAGDGPSSREEGVVRSKPGKKRMQARVARKAQPRSKKVSPPRRSPRETRVCNKRMDLKSILEIDSDSEDDAPVRHRRT